APSGISYSAKKGKLFFIDKKDGKSVLYQSGPDGDGLTELKVFNEDILNIAVDDSTDKIFYSEVSTNTIFSTDMSGESKTKVHQTNNLRPALFLVESKKTPGTNLLLWND